MSLAMGARMVFKLWDNLLKFLLMRLSIQLSERIQSAYRLGVHMMRKLSPRVIRFHWLQRMINRLLPCGQMVHRYIDPVLGIEKFFSVLNERGVRYTVLRWFEDLPHLSKADDIDMLVDDDDLAKIKDLFVTLPTGISCDIYSVSPIPGASYRKGMSLYPSHLAREILETSIMYKQIYRVPDPWRHFLSLAYHAVYHWAEQSGLPYAQGDAPVVLPRQRSYLEKLVVLAEACEIKISPDLRSLHEFLTECGWSPRIDVLRALARRSSWLTALLHETVSGKIVSSKTIRYALNVHGIRVLIEANCETFMEYLRRDFCFFHNAEEDSSNPHLRISFLKQEPPWKEIAPQTVPLFKTLSSTVYTQGTNRYVDHDREVLTIYDLDRDEGTVFSTDPDAMYRVAYNMLMTRIGLRLDAISLHRINAFAISLNDVALLLLGPGGCGKTTLGLEMMKSSQVCWLSDDIVPIHSNCRALPFPASPRLVEGSTVPWLPPATDLLKSPWPKDRPKVQIPSSLILSRVSASAKLGALLLCSRKPDVTRAIRRVGFFEGFMSICGNALTGKGFALVKAYQIQFSLSAVCKMALVYIYRVRRFIRLAWTVPVFRFDMGGQVSEDASFLLNTWTVMRQHMDGDRSSLATASAISSVEGGKLRRQSTRHE
jgi:hypothetical protein